MNTATSEFLRFVSQNFRYKAPHFPSRQGFSLTELLVVISIMVLIGAGTPSLLSSYRSSNLTTAGNQVVDIAKLARNNSLSRSAMTAVIMVSSTSPNLSNVSNKAMTIIELSPNQTSWRQVVSWLYLSSQVNVYANLAALQPSALPVPTGGSLPTLRVNGSKGLVTLTSADYVCYVFNPDGTSYNPSASLPKVYVQYATDAAPSNGTQAGNLKNYYDVVLSDAGGVHVIRP